MGAPWADDLGTDRIIASGFGKWGGGLYDLTDGNPVAIDDLASVGICVGGGRFWRVLRAPGEQTGACELLSYDERGLRTYNRLDQIRDPHDVCFHEGAPHVVSSWDTAVWRVDGDRASAFWKEDTVPDSWHPNSLFEHRGALHVSVFGRFERHKQWNKGAAEVRGFVRDLTNGRDVLTGLSHPHQPKLVGDRWYVCESGRGAITEFSPVGVPLRRAVIGRFTRGLAIVGGYALVGGNAARDDDEDRGEICVVNLESFEIVERILMPCLETYDIVQVPAPLAAGLRIGFASSPSRAAEQGLRERRAEERQPAPPAVRVSLASPEQVDDLAQVGRALPDDQRQGQVDAVLPETIVAGGTVVVRAAVWNQSALDWATVPPHPICVRPRWYPIGEDGTEGETLTGAGAPLPHRLGPGEWAALDVVLLGPDEPGRYRLALALHQVGVVWFGMRRDRVVEVLPAPAVDGDDAGAGEGTTNNDVTDGAAPERAVPDEAATA